MSDSTGSARPRAVLYLRQSTYREESISLELQEAAGRDYCKRHGYTVVAIEADPGITGRTWKRPAVLRTMSMIENGNADVIVLWKWSRLSRARLDWAIAVDKVESQGGRIESATEPTDTTTSAGRLSRGILAEFAAFESERIGEEWQNAIRSRQARGLPGNGGTRFGYVIVEKDRYEPDPVTGPVLAELYRRANHGESMLSLAAWLNSEGVPTSTGGQWSRSTLRPLLDSGFGAGLIRTNVKTPAESLYLPGAHEPVIGSDEWDEYQRRRALVGRLPARNAARYPLTGLLRCGDCGAGMSAMSRRGNNGAVQLGYGCNRYQKYRTGRYVTTLRARVEGYVKDKVFELAGDLTAARAAEAKLVQHRTASARDAAKVARDLTKVDAQLAKLTVGWTTGVVDDDGYKLAAEQLRERREALLTREAVLDRNSMPGEGARALAMGLAETWDQLEQSELRAALSVLVSEVRVTPPAGATRGGATYSGKWAWGDPM